MTCVERGLVVFGAGLIDLIDTTNRSEEKEGQTATNCNPKLRICPDERESIPHQKHKLPHHCFVKKTTTTNIASGSLLSHSYAVVGSK